MRSKASVVQCMVCSKFYSSLTLQVVCKCQRFFILRKHITDLGVDCSTLHFLDVKPTDVHFSQVVALAVCIADAERGFWREH